MHILERHYGKRPKRLLLNWTTGARKQDALMEFPYWPEMVEKTERHFDRVVGKIKQKDFQISTPPESKICEECDFRHFCTEDGTIK